MYIKIKHIKNLLLVSAIIFFAGVNYFTYVKADIATANCSKTIDADCDGLIDDEERVYGTDINNVDSDGDGYSDGVEVKSGYDPTKPAPGDRVSKLSADAKGDENLSVDLTDKLAEDLQQFIKEKGENSITTSDVDDFVEQQYSDTLNSHITLESLPEIDSSQMKVLPQNYDGLNESDRKGKLKQDAIKYYSQIAYALASNAPVEMIESSEFSVFRNDFEKHFASLASEDVDYDYFANLAKKTDLFLEQVKGIEVPASMIDMHKKALKIIDGYLSLRNEQISTNDPIGKMILLSKIQDLMVITSDFFEKDFQEYNDSLK